MQQSPRNRTGLIMAILVIAGLAAGVGLGLLLGWVVLPVTYVDTKICDLAPEHKDEYGVLVAAAYGKDGDLAKAQNRLAELEVPNTNQWLSDLIDRCAGNGRAEADIQALAVLAQDMGVSNPQLVAFLPSPTPRPTDTPAPTPTSPPTDTPTAEPTATETPVPTDTPAPEPTATETPVPEPTDTATTAPPTNTPKPANTQPPPKPTNTPAPTKPAGPKFSIVESRMLHINENSGCLGNHNIFVEVRDKNGAPLSGVTVCRYWSLKIQDPAACKVSGVTDAKPPGWVEFDIHMTGDQVYIASDMSGQGQLSPLSDNFDTRDEMIPLPLLLSNGYCESEEDCRIRLAENRLCRGHYSYKIVFQRNF